MDRSLSGISSQAIGCDEVAAANRASLLGLPGVTATYVQLLEAAGVDTLRELQRCVPENLYARIMRAARRHHIGTLPRLDEVRGWVALAKRMCR